MHADESEEGEVEEGYRLEGEEVPSRAGRGGVVVMLLLLRDRRRDWAVLRCRREVRGEQRSAGEDCVQEGVEKVSGQDGGRHPPQCRFLPPPPIDVVDLDDVPGGAVDVRAVPLVGRGGGGAGAFDRRGVAHDDHYPSLARCDVNVRWSGGSGCCGCCGCCCAQCQRSAGRFLLLNEIRRTKRFDENDNAPIYRIGVSRWVGGYVSYRTDSSRSRG